LKQILRRVAAVLLLASWALAAVDAPRSVLLEDLTWQELRDEIRAGKTTILVPIGGTEQNGPHMALGKHNARVRVLAEKIAVKLGNAIVAPVVAYTPEGSIDRPSQHMRFPGTITIPDDAFERTLVGVARSFRRHGFKDVVFLGDHGGYRESLDRVAARLNKSWADSNERVHPLPEYYRAMTDDFEALLRKRGHSDAEIGSHAGLADTSLTLATNRALVRPLPETPLKPEDGVHGDPRRATAELGAEGVDLIVARSVEAIRKAVRRK
jgi:creatinine amidohydrolase/Fe(II)-dependent formamide hydrolase-like protein